MSEKKTDSDATKDQIQQTDDLLKALDKAVAQKTAELQQKLDTATSENKILKQQNIALNSVIEDELKAEKITRIMTKGDFKRDTLEAKSVRELQQIDEILSAHKGMDATFKQIRVGNASESIDRSTVGSPYGLTGSEKAKWLKGDL